MPGPADLPAWLIGRWSVARTINDGAGAFTGEATFTADGDRDTVWHETGWLRLEGYRGEAHRTLLIGPGLDHGTWQVRFDDGRPFHPLDIGDGRCEVRHRCGPDVYDGVYAVGGADALSVCWRVTGPGRRDAIVSDYRRVL